MVGMCFSPHSLPSASRFFIALVEAISENTKIPFFISIFIFCQAIFHVE